MCSKKLNHCPKGDNILKAQQALLGAIEGCSIDKLRCSEGGVKTKNKNTYSYLAKEDVENGLKDGTLIEGYLRINKKNVDQAYIFHENKNKIFISGMVARNGASDGDLVVVKPSTYLYKPKNSGRNVFVQHTSGVVVFIKRQNRRIIIGSVDLNGVKLCNEQGSYVTVTSRNKENLKIVLTFDYIKGLNFVPLSDYLYKIELLKCDSLPFSKRFQGKILEGIGKIGSIEAETKCILLEHNCERVPYPPGSEKYYPDTKGFCIPSEEFHKREDLRQLCVFTIDPEDAVDLDDALSVKELENGNYEIGVHIADVTYFFEPDTCFDDIVKANATSIYFPHEVYHMLPIDLVHVASLTPGTEKLAFSVFWEFSLDGTIISYRFSRSVVISCAQFSYDNVQKIIEDLNGNDNQELSNLPKIFNGFTLHDCMKNIVVLLNISKILYGRRFGNGIVPLEKTNLKFSLDPETKMPNNGLRTDLRKKSSQIIQEFMLLANTTVARKLFSSYPDISLLRVHEPPDDSAISRLKEMLSRLGIHVRIDSPACIYKSLAQYNGDDTTSLLVKRLTISNMKRAKYWCSEPEGNSHHFALNTPYYTHFTSPIRRYADVVVHRLLSAALGYTEKPEWTPSYIRSIVSILNDVTYNAVRAEETMEQFFLRLYLKRHGPLLLECVVIELQEHYFDVLSLDYNFRVRVFIDLLDVNIVKDLILDYNESGLLSSIIIIWKKNGSSQEISLKTQLYVNVLVGKLQTIEGRLISP